MKLSCYGEKNGKKVNYNCVYIQSVTKYTCLEYIIFILYIKYKC